MKSMLRKKAFKSHEGKSIPTRNRRAFTLVELLVVVVILGILTTLAFVNFGGYTKGARDAVRVTDAKGIQKAIELYKMEDGKYPLPTAATTQTIPGLEGNWYVGEFGEEIANQVEELVTFPQDPSEKTNYYYALSEDRKSYRIVTILEETGEEYVVANKLQCEINYKLVDNQCIKMTCELELTQAEADELNTLTGENYDIAGWCSQTTLSINGKNLLKIPSGIGKMIQLQILNLDNNVVNDITSISKLTSLKKLSLSNNQISDIAPLSGLHLTNLSLSDNRISSVSGLSQLDDLLVLALNNNQISDISAVGGLTNLKYLLFEGNTVSDISVVSSLHTLTMLNLNHNEVSDISAVGGLTNLKYLLFEGNTVSDISVVSSLHTLTTLNLNDNEVDDISVLGGLTSLTKIFAKNNNISDIYALKNLSNLKGLGLIGNNLGNLNKLFLNYDSVLLPYFGKVCETLNGRNICVENVMSQPIKITVE